MISSFGVVLDACVLVPITLCDTLLCTADYRLYRPLWSEAILDETVRTLIKNGLSPEKAEYRRAEMQGSYPEATITGYESLIPSMGNDEKDRHVLAAAVRGSAQIIVTANIKHFPENILGPLGIRAETPDDFLMDLLGFDPVDVLKALKGMAAQKTRPPMTQLEMLQRIGKSAPGFAAAALMIQESDPATSC